jgi:MFS family permease
MTDDWGHAASASSREPQSQAGRVSPIGVLLGFALFGVFWGTWGAALPAVQAQAHIGDAAFGGSLLLIGVGALASMRLTGHLLGRFDNWVVPAVVVAFAACALAAGTAVSPLTLAMSLLVLGVLSGAFDVVVNHAAVTYEVTGRPLVSAGHAAFSGAVVVSSALTGVARSAGISPSAIFTVVAVILCAAALPMRYIAAPRSAAARQHAEPPDLPATERRPIVAVQLAILGILCALANLVESAQQSWSARHLESVLLAPPHISGLGPSAFALATVAARLASQALARRRIPPRLTVACGALVAAIGTAVTALAPTATVCLAGVTLAGLGTGVCVPTIISVAGAGRTHGQRAAAVSTVMTLAYLGFVAGPGVVGLTAGYVGLRAALGTIAAIATLLCLAAAMMPTNILAGARHPRSRLPEHATRT